MREQKKVTVNGDDYLITQFGARKGVKLGKKVARVILPAVGKVFQEGSQETNFGNILETVADNLDELDDHTIEELLSETTHRNMNIDFDNHFAGNYGGLFLLLWEVIQFNFEDVFQIVPGDTEV